MTAGEFADLIDVSGDIMFNCCGKGYTILGWWDDGPNISEHYNEEEARVFKDGKDLVDHYMIDGKPLCERMNELEFTHIN